MEKKRHLPEWFSTYAEVIVPEFDEEGMVIGAEFPHERVEGAEKGPVISAAFGFGNARQHLVDHYFALLTPEHKAMWEPRAKKTCSVEPPAQETMSTMWNRPDLAKVLAETCAIGSMPLSLSCNPGIQYLICSLLNDPTLSLPSARSVTRSFDKLSERVMPTVKEKIAAARISPYGPVWVGVSTDMWSSLSKGGHVGVNVRVLDSEFVARNYAIGCNPLPHPHSGENIAKSVVEQLSDVGILPHDIAAGTTDSGSAALVANQLIGGPFTATIPCVCHVLNLCGEAGSEEPAFHKAFAAIVAMLNYFQGTKRLQALTKKQTDLKMPQLRFIAIADTRWNYGIDVLERALENQAAVDAPTAEDFQVEGTVSPQTAAEWGRLKSDFDNGIALLQCTLPLLRLVAKAMRTFESATTATTSKIYPAAWEIWEEAEKLCSSDSLAGRQFAQKFVEVLNEKIFYASTPRLPRCAEVLDPTTAFRMKWQKTSRYEDPTTDELREIRGMIADSLFAKAPVTVRTNIFGETVSSDEGSPRLLFLTQFGEYLTHLNDLWSAPEDTFAWWKAHREKFPVVAHAARCLLCSFSSAAETERLFSTGAYIVNKWRNRLRGDRAGQLITLSRALRSFSKEDAKACNVNPVISVFGRDAERKAEEPPDASADFAASGLDHDME